MKALIKSIGMCSLCGLLSMASVRGLAQELTADAAEAAPAANVADVADAASTEAQAKPEAKKAAAALPGDKPGMATAAKRSTTVRLPAYFGSLVDSRQRAAIYQIREAVSAKIAALELQLEELRRAEMRDIEAVLSDEQRQRLEMLRAARTGPRATQNTELSGT